MRNFGTILRFGWPYLRRYQVRLWLGLGLGVLFGLSGALILGASNTLLERVNPQPQTGENKEGLRIPPRRPGVWPDRVSEASSKLKQHLQNAIDPWLPRQGRPLDAKQATGVLLLLPALFAFRGFIGYMSSYCLGWVSERVINDLRLDVLIKLNSLSLDFFNRSTMGDLLTRINADTVSLQRTLNLGFSDLIKEPVTVLAIFGFLCYLDWRLTLFVMIFLPVCVVPVIVLGRKARRASKGNVSATVSQSSLLVEVLSSMRIVKAFKLETIQ